MNRILTMGAILILPLSGISAQPALQAFGNGDSDESASDRAFDYIEQVREQRHGHPACGR